MKIVRKGILLRRGIGGRWWALIKGKAWSFKRLEGRWWSKPKGSWLHYMDGLYGPAKTLKEAVGKVLDGAHAAT